MKTTRVPVLIAGGGTVGLALAGELGWRGIASMLVERENEVNPHPRANAVANRTMEYFRRWGIDSVFTENGIPPDHPADYFYVTSMHGREVYRIALPSHNQMLSMLESGSDDPRLTHSPYLKTILGQDKVDRILRDFVSVQPAVQARFGWELVAFRQTAPPGESAVGAVIRNRQTGECEEVVADYMVACDGGRSMVRTTLDIPLVGSGSLARFVAIHFEAVGLNRQFGPANIYFQLKERFGGFLMNWDGGKTYTYHYLLHAEESAEDLDASVLIRKLAGWEIPYKLHSVQPWNAHRLVAKTYRSGRVFLAGDAAHLFTPTGGFGMNTGISDAMDIAWKLAAVLQGWGGKRLLDSYEEERRPIGVQNTDTSAGYFYALQRSFRFGDELDGESAVGASARKKLQRELDGQVGLIDSSGLLLGYRYEGSSICVPDGSPPTPFSPQHYWPTARPGHRAPHVWIDSRTSILDLFGRDFTLLRLADADVEPLAEAARNAGVPLNVLDLRNERAFEAYERKLVLVRPDLMVAWRGDEAPSDPAAVIDCVRGEAAVLRRST